jgi:hypothetical protein
METTDFTDFFSFLVEIAIAGFVIWLGLGFIQSLWYYAFPGDRYGYDHSQSISLLASIFFCLIAVTVYLLVYHFVGI